MAIMGRPWILDYDPANCAIGAAVGLIGERPTFLVLREVFNGVRRFADMQRRTGMPRQVLSDRLARLVGDGLLRKVPYQESGQRSRYEYRLTDKGLDLYPVLVALMEWGDRYAVGTVGPQVLLRHRDCGEPVRLQLSCQAGHVLGSAREVTPVPGPGARKIA
jgi:DNA-binding HxlR family transcriptional regulator